MAIFLESDREVAIDGVGLLEPGNPVEVDVNTFKAFHGVHPKDANFPHFIKLVDDEEKVVKNVKTKIVSDIGEGGE